MFVLAAVLLVRARRSRAVPVLVVTFAVTVLNAVLFSLGYWAD